MPQKCETPLVDSGASRNSCGGSFRAPDTLSQFRAQRLSSRFGLPVSRADLIVPLAFGEVVHA